MGGWGWWEREIVAIVPQSGKTLKNDELSSAVAFPGFIMSPKKTAWSTFRLTFFFFFFLCTCFLLYLFLFYLSFSRHLFLAGL